MGRGVLPHLCIPPHTSLFPFPKMSPVSSTRKELRGVKSSIVYFWAAVKWVLPLIPPRCGAGEQSRALVSPQPGPCPPSLPWLSGSTWGRWEHLLPSAALL